jgi:hypothetical protein
MGGEDNSSIRIFLHYLKNVLGSSKTTQVFVRFSGMTTLISERKVIPCFSGLVPVLANACYGGFQGSLGKLMECKSKYGSAFFGSDDYDKLVSNNECRLLEINTKPFYSIATVCDHFDWRVNLRIIAKFLSLPTSHLKLYWIPLSLIPGMVLYEYDGDEDLHFNRDHWIISVLKNEILLKDENETKVAKYDKIVALCKGTWNPPTTCSKWLHFDPELADIIFAYIHPADNQQIIFPPMCIGWDWALNPCDDYQCS